MRVPGRRKALSTIRMVVRKRLSPYDVSRSTQGQTGRFGESGATSTTTISDVPMWLFDPNEVNIDTEYGDRLGGDLQGLAIPQPLSNAADIQVHDRVDHGGETYEVERIIHLPDNDDKQLKMFSLQKVNN